MNGIGPAPSTGAPSTGAPSTGAPSTGAPSGTARVCRVVVDVAALPRPFDYLVPEALAASVTVGTIVRVGLAGRRVRGWVVADGVDPDTDRARLRPLIGVISAGPPPEVVDLTAWVAWRFAGPRAPLLRAASPAAVVDPAAVASLSPPGSLPPGSSGDGAPAPSPPSLGPAGPLPPGSSGDGARAPSPLSLGPAGPSSPGSGEAAPASSPLSVPLPDPDALGPKILVDEAVALAAEVAAVPVAVVRWPPAAGWAPLVAALRAPSGSTVVVVPDPRVAAALVNRLSAAGIPTLGLPTDGRPSERARAWLAARGGQRLVVGGRSAVFAPVPDLALVVVVDDGAETLKEERSPRWLARDVALERAGRAKAQVVLASPTPPIEALAAAGVVAVPVRSAERAGWPLVEVVDRRSEAPGLGMFSSRLVAAARQALAENTRVVCVLNRRGRARLLACSACGDLARCERCGAALAEAVSLPAGSPAPPVLGRWGPDPIPPVGRPFPAEPALACPACGWERPRVCAGCGATRMRVLRTGVTRLRDDLAALLPGTGVAVVDASTGGLPTERVLIGTEAVLHRPIPRPVGLVAFLDFDSEVLAPRYRAAEQGLWLVVRAARLLGPRRLGGRILVQTRLGRHEVTDAAVNADPGVLVAADDVRRRALRLPPYGALARVSGDPGAVAVLAGLVGGDGVEVATGEGRSQSDLVLRAGDADELAETLAAALPEAREAGRLTVEVDPLRV